MMVHRYEEDHLEACWKRLRYSLASVFLGELEEGEEYIIKPGSDTEQLEDGLKLSFWVDVKEASNDH